MTMILLTSPLHPCRRAIAWTIMILLVVLTFCCCAEEHVVPQANNRHRLVSSSPLGSHGQESWGGVTLPSAAAAVERGIRREKSTAKTPGLDSKEKEDSTYPSSTRAPINLVTVKATGLTMTLAGVGPLDEKARAAWQDVTREFIGEDIMRFSKEMNQLEVSVKFVLQNPAYNGESHNLSKFKGRGLSGIRQMMVEISFDVVIEIESEINKSHDANKYVAHAFSSDARKIVYMRKLLMTGNSAFYNVGTVTVDANLFTAKNESKDAKEIGAIAGFAVMGVLCIAAIFHVLYCSSRTSAVGDDETEEDREQGSNKQSRTETDSISSEQDDAPSEGSAHKMPGGVMPDDESLVSHYYEGNISIAWSLDTDIPQTPRIHNSKTLLPGGLSRESSEESLFVDDDTEAPPPDSSLQPRSSPAVNLAQDAPHDMKTTKEKELYEV